MSNTFVIEQGYNEVSINLGTTPTPPSAPASLALIAGPGSVSASWSASSGATSYNLYRSLHSANSYTKLVNTTLLSYQDTSGIQGTAYDYYVTAVNGYGESSGSTVQTLASQIIVSILVSVTIPTANVTLTGNGTTWSGSPFSIVSSLPAGSTPAIASQNVASATSATLTLTLNGATKVLLQDQQSNQFLVSVGLGVGGGAVFVSSIPFG